MKIANCLKCNNHEIILDRDPYDWFCDDDMAVVCKLVKNPKQNLDSKYLADRNEFKSITRSCRPHYLTKESTVPIWCPLKKKQQ